jgi:hypothetical protein
MSDIFDDIRSNQPNTLIKPLYEVSPPPGLDKSTNVELVILQREPKHKLLYEVPPPKELTRTPEIIEYEVFENVHKKPKFLYEVPPPIKLLPPPDRKTVNKLMVVKPEKHFDSYRSNSNHEHYDDVLRDRGSRLNDSRIEYENQMHETKNNK